MFAPMPSASVRIVTAGETGAFHEHARCVTQVLRERLKERQPALIAIGFLRLLDSTKLTPRCVTCFFLVHAAAHIFFGERIDVRAQFCIEFSIQILLAEDSQLIAMRKFAATPSQAPSARPRRRVMSAAMRSQLSVSAKSCFRPLRVSE